jgi:ribonucleoside-diphosphate reductase alpha chain
MAKEGSTVGGLMDVIGTLTSLALQYGVPLKALVDKFSHMRFEPSGWTKNPDIPMAKSVPDYIFRWLGMQFIHGFREANAPKREGADEKAGGSGQRGDAEPGASPAAAVQAVKDVLAAHQVPASALQSIHHENGARKAKPVTLEDSGIYVLPLTSDDDSPAVRSQQFSTFQTDAPACDNCGAITVRNGNCYLCHNCGNSMGCS